MDYPNSNAGAITIEMLQRAYADLRIPSEVVKLQNEANRIMGGMLDVLSARIYPPLTAVKTAWAQVRFPRSKKSRIRKKWAKDQRNYGMISKIVRMEKPLEVPKVKWMGVTL